LLSGCRTVPELLDALAGARARLAEGDPAVLAQRELLALQEHLAVALGRDVGAVGAVVLEHPFVLAPLDGAVLARSLLVGDHQAAALVAPDRDRVVVAPARELRVAVLQAQHRGGGARLGTVSRDGGAVLDRPPHDLAQQDFFRLALHLDRLQRPREPPDRPAETPTHS